MEHPNKSLHPPCSTPSCRCCISSASSSAVSCAREALQMSNSDAIVPRGLSYVPNFVTACESRSLWSCVYEVDDDDKTAWTNRGFETKYKCRQYERDEMEAKFGWLLDRLTTAAEDTAGHDASRRPTQLTAEERMLRTNSTATATNVTTFESSAPRSAQDPSSYVAQLTLYPPAQSTTRRLQLRQLINQPEAPHDVQSWNNKSHRHATTFLMPPNGLILKQNESLWDWRCCLFTATCGDMNRENATHGCHCGQNKDENYKVLVLKFRCKFEKEQIYNFDNNTNDDHHGAMVVGRKSQTLLQNTIRDESLLLADMLTIVITTSPIKSNPSTELLERTFATFILGGHDFAVKCRKIIICDGCRVLSDDDTQNNNNEKRKDKKDQNSISRKHSNTKQALRNGIATTEQAANYNQFKIKLRTLCDDAHDPMKQSPFCNTVMVELEERHGYGFALRHVLLQQNNNSMVTTPYVCVIQHDRTFMRQTPIAQVVHAMVNDNTIKYVGMSMRSNLMYRDIFLSKYGKESYSELLSMVKMPNELRLSTESYGFEKSMSSLETNLNSFMGGVGMDERQTKKKMTNIQSLAQTYRKSAQYLSHLDQLPSSPSSSQKIEKQQQQQVKDKLEQTTEEPYKQLQQEVVLMDYRNNGIHVVSNTTSSSTPVTCCGDERRRDGGVVQMSLTPTLFWYDNIHICETSHYRDFIFHPKYRMVTRGGFVEDKTSPIIARSVERLGLVYGHAKFGCYLLDDHGGLFFTGHLDGGTYIPTDQRTNTTNK